MHDPHLVCTLLAGRITEYKKLAYKNAGIDPLLWQSGKGFRANKEILDKLYIYYQSLYFKQPQNFLWAGLARLTGGQVLYGMNNIVRIAKDPCALTVNIVAVAKAIFENMAWQHECFIDDPALLFEICTTPGCMEPAKNDFSVCWEKIGSFNTNDINEGNKLLLENEQLDTIQPYYEKIKADAYSARYFAFTSLVMRNIHPYHKRFIFLYPFKNVTHFADRWRWICGDNGMWQRWVNCDINERNRLVALSTDNIIKHNWEKKSE